MYSLDLTTPDERTLTRDSAPPIAPLRRAPGPHSEGAIGRVEQLGVAVPALRGWMPAWAGGGA